MSRNYVTKAWIQKEEHVAVITVTDPDGTAIDVSGATITMVCKDNLDGSSTGYQFTKADGDFTKSYGGDSSKVSVDLTSVNMNFYGIKYVITTFVISATVAKKGIFKIDNERSPE